MRTILIISLIGVICSSCVYDRAEIIPFINKSDSAIYGVCFCESSLVKGRNLQIYKKITIKGQDTSIYPTYRAEKDSIGYIDVYWSKEKAVRDCKDKKLRFFFIKESVMKEYSWDEICERQLYAKKLVFTEEELVKMDWTVVYE